MIQELTVSFPFGSTVFFYGYTNAGEKQKGIVTFEDGSTIVMEGTGEGNKPTEPSTVTKVIPASGQSADGFHATVQVLAGADGVTPSALLTTTANSWDKVVVVSVLSDDGGGSTAGDDDADFNDCILLAMYMNPNPSAKKK
jgi:hypothetical protein